MSRTLFDTQEDRELAIAQFKSLILHPGWLLLVEVLDENIELVKNQILNGIEGESKEDIDRLRDRVRGYINLRNSPDILIRRLETVTDGNIQMDPYTQGPRRIDN